MGAGAEDEGGATSMAFGSKIAWRSITAAEVGGEAQGGRRGISSEEGRYVQGY